MTRPARSDINTRVPGTTIARFGLIGCVCLALNACKKIEEAPRNYALLATDIHVSVAHHQLVLPFIALSDYRNRQSFSLRRTGELPIQAGVSDVRESTDPASPTLVDRISLEIGTYGWDDGDTKQRQICPMLTRKWAHSVCDNPWAVVQQSLPPQIDLVDLSRLNLASPQHVPRCIENASPQQAIPLRRGDTAMICEQEIFGGKPGEYHVAAVRIDGDLGAIWSITRSAQEGETAEARMARQGQAVLAFVRYGLGAREDFSKLYDILCGLRAPNSPPGVRHLDCGDTSGR